MKRILIFALIFLTLIGCATSKKTKPKPQPEFPGLDRYQFEQTKDADVHLKTANTEKINIRFDGVPLRDGMHQLTDLTGVSIVWSQTLDETVLYGSYFEQPLGQVLESVSRRVDASVSEFGGIYYVGQSRDEDTVSTVVRTIPAEKEELLKALESAKTEKGSVAIVGSSLYISDTLETVRKMLSNIEKMREHAEHSYLAEVFFIRVKEDDFIKVTGDLKIKSVDVFASTTNLDELFQMFLDASAGKTFATIEQRPVLYLSEGRKANFDVGSELVREKKAVNENGIVETTGYEKFNDGLRLSLSLVRVSDENYTVDFDLEVSTFDKSKNDIDSVPGLDKSQLRLPGLLVNDSKVYYIGSLKRKDTRKGFTLICGDFGKSNDVLTVWFRVRELKK